MPRFPHLQDGNYRVVERVKWVNRKNCLAVWLVHRETLCVSVIAIMASKMEGTTEVYVQIPP